MVAYFYSKLTKQVRAVLAAVIFAICLLGTHWIGFSHSISHSSTQSQLAKFSYSQEMSSTLSHGSDLCHLFDALTLAGFIPIQDTAIAFIQGVFLKSPNVYTLVATKPNPNLYRSRAPPIYIL